MKSNTDKLLLRLEMVSDSTLWPNYYISKEKLQAKIQIKPTTEDRLLEKIKNMLKNKKNTSPVKKKVSNKPKNLQPLNVTTKSLNTSYFHDKYLNVLKMIPIADRSKSIRQTAHPLFKRNRRTVRSPFPMNRTILLSNIEVQTTFSVDD